MSCAIETARFSEFFGNAPVIAVEGRTYPVDVLYEPPDERDDARLREELARTPQERLRAMLEARRT